MYIYSATLQAKPGRGGEVAPLVQAARDEISKATGHTAYGWAASSGAPIGAFGISTRVESNVQLVEFQQKLAASADYQKAARKLGKQLHGPAETYMNQVIGAAGEQGAPTPFVTVTQSTIVNGHLGDAMGWGLEVMEYVHRATGLSGVFTSAAAGNFFGVSWIFSANDAAELDSANLALQADLGYISLIDKAGGFFVAGSATRSTLMQMP